MDKSTEIITRKQLDPYLSFFNECITLSIEEFRKNLGRYLLVYSKRTNSNIIRDMIIDKVRKFVEKNKKYMWIKEKRGMFLLCIKSSDGHIFSIRFKKLNNNFLTSNIPTKQSFNFNYHIPFPDMPSDSIIINLNAGYVLTNTSFTDIKTYITCPSGLSSIAWKFEFTRVIESSENIIESKEIFAKPKEINNGKSILRVKSKFDKSKNPSN